MNVKDIMFMNDSGKVKPDSDIIDILWWLKMGSGKKPGGLYPSDGIYPDDARYPVSSESN